MTQVIVTGPMSLSSQQAQDIGLELLTTDPTDFEGRIYFNTTRNTLRLYTGSEWVEWGTGSIDSYANSGALPATGLAGVVYINEADNELSTWDAVTSAYVAVGGSSGGSSGVTYRAAGTNSYFAYDGTVDLSTVTGTNTVHGPADISIIPLDIDNSVAYGWKAKPYGDKSTAVGVETEANTDCSSFGYRSLARGSGSIAIGGAILNGSRSIGIGWDAFSNSSEAIFIGKNCRAVADGVAIGVDTWGKGAGSVTIGHNAQNGSAKNDCITLGRDSASSAPRCLAIGSDSSAQVDGDIALGADSTAYDGISIGHRANCNGTTLGTAISIGEDTGRNVTGINNILIGSGLDSGVISSTSANQLCFRNLTHYSGDAAALAAGLNAGYSVYHTRGILKVAGTAGIINHTESFTAVSTVVVTHNLEKIPCVTIVDASGVEISASTITHDTNLQCTIVFGSATTGEVSCN